MPDFVAAWLAAGGGSRGGQNVEVAAATVLAAATCSAAGGGAALAVGWRIYRLERRPERRQTVDGPTRPVGHMYCLVRGASC